ncbi:hypothetical protein GW17_00028477, partial [Ensete ventricosum]
SGTNFSVGLADSYCILCMVLICYFFQCGLYGKAGVQIVDICLSTRSHNGGLINLQELCSLLCQRRKVAREAVTEDDCLRAISKLKAQGYVTIEEVEKRLSWSSGRAIDALETLLKGTESSGLGGGGAKNSATEMAVTWG